MFVGRWVDLDMKFFSKKSIESLKHYVYALVDPETNEIFYVGRGKGNRRLQHLKITSDDESEKKKAIAGIRARGATPFVSSSSF